MLCLLRWAVRFGCLLAVLLAQPHAHAHEPAKTESLQLRQTDRAQSMVKTLPRRVRLRDPNRVGARLDAICADAGYPAKERRRCAETMAARCEAQGISPTSPRCWHWFIDRDVSGQLDRRAALRPLTADGRRGSLSVRPK